MLLRRCMLKPFSCSSFVKANGGDSTRVMPNNKGLEAELWRANAKLPDKAACDDRPEFQIEFISCRPDWLVFTKRCGWIGTIKPSTMGPKPVRIGSPVAGWATNSSVSDFRRRQSIALNAFDSELAEEPRLPDVLPSTLFAFEMDAELDEESDAVEPALDERVQPKLRRYVLVSSVGRVAKAHGLSADPDIKIALWNKSVNIGEKCLKTECQTDSEIKKDSMRHWKIMIEWPNSQYCNLIKKKIAILSMQTVVGVRSNKKWFVHFFFWNISKIWLDDRKSLKKTI